MQQFFGEFRCIHCRQLLPIGLEYPWVGRIAYCENCRGYMVVHGHYLGYNGRVNFALRTIPQRIIDKMNKRLNLGMKPHETP